METRDIIKKLREKNGLTQEQMAERLMISRQAVSRWENGETQPDTESFAGMQVPFLRLILGGVMNGNQVFGVGVRRGISRPIIRCTCDTRTHRSFF